MGAENELAQFRRVAFRVPFPRKFNREPTVVAAWIDASVSALPCTNNPFSPELTAAIVSHLKLRGVRDTVILEGFAKTGNAFSPPILSSVSEFSMQKYNGPVMRPSSKAEQERNKKHTLEVLRQKHWLATGDLMEQQRIEKIAIDLVMGYGEAVQMRSDLRAMQQEMLSNIRMWRNQITYPRNTRAR